MDVIHSIAANSKLAFDWGVMKNDSLIANTFESKVRNPFNGFWNFSWHILQYHNYGRNTGCL